MNRTQAIQILMLNSDASFDDVKYAYRKLSLELHPDKIRIKVMDDDSKMY